MLIDVFIAVFFKIIPKELQQKCLIVKKKTYIATSENMLFFKVYSLLSTRAKVVLLYKIEKNTAPMDTKNIYGGAFKNPIGTVLRGSIACHPEEIHS
jgi:hypothetical protein